MLPCTVAASSVGCLSAFATDSMFEWAKVKRECEQVAACNKEWLSVKAKMQTDLMKGIEDGSLRVSLREAIPNKEADVREKVESQLLSGSLPAALSAYSWKLKMQHKLQVDVFTPRPARHPTPLRSQRSARAQPSQYIGQSSARNTPTPRIQARLDGSVGVSALALRIASPTEDAGVIPEKSPDENSVELTIQAHQKIIKESQPCQTVAPTPVFPPESPINCVSWLRLSPRRKNTGPRCFPTPRTDSVQSPRMNSGQGRTPRTIFEGWFTPRGVISKQDAKPEKSPEKFPEANQAPKEQQGLADVLHTSREQAKVVVANLMSLCTANGEEDLKPERFAEASEEGEVKAEDLPGLNSDSVAPAPDAQSSDAQSPYGPAWGRSDGQWLQSARATTKRNLQWLKVQQKLQTDLQTGVDDGSLSTALHTNIPVLDLRSIHSSCMALHTNKANNELKPEEPVCAATHDISDTVSESMALHTNIPNNKLKPEDPVCAATHEISDTVSESNEKAILTEVNVTPPRKSKAIEDATLKTVVPRLNMAALRKEDPPQRSFRAQHLGPIVSSRIALLTAKSETSDEGTSRTFNGHWSQQSLDAKTMAPMGSPQQFQSFSLSSRVISDRTHRSQENSSCGKTMSTKASTSNAATPEEIMFDADETQELIEQQTSQIWDLIEEMTPRALMTPLKLVNEQADHIRALRNEVAALKATVQKAPGNNRLWCACGIGDFVSLLTNSSSR